MVFLSKFKNILISPRIIVALIILTLTACAIGFFVPQIAYKSPSFFETWQEQNIYTYRFVTRLQLHRVFTSYWFLTLVTFLLASLTTSLYQQVKANLNIRKQETGNRGQEAVGSGQWTDDGRLNDEFKRINEILSKNKFGERGVSGDKIIFSKNLIGRWGSTIFHTGLLLIIISALIVACMQKRGFANLIEGEEFDGKEQSFEIVEKGVLAGDHDIGFKTYMSKLDHTYWETGKLKHLESHLVIVKDSVETAEKISINLPLQIDGINIYQSYDYGYTLTFILKQSSGEEIITQFNMDRAANVSSYTKGRSGFPLTSYIIGMKFIPDLDKKSFYLNKPIVYLDVDEGLNRVFKGLVVPGSAVKIKDDILYFSDVRFWSGLTYTSIPGISLAYAGFAVIILGAVIMFGFPYKVIYANFDHEGRLTDITGSTRRYNNLFKEEIEEIRKEIGNLSS